VGNKIYVFRFRLGAARAGPAIVKRPAGSNLHTDAAHLRGCHAEL